MSDLYKNQYRVPSARLPYYDYSQNGMYFVTICTHEKNYFFGEIHNNEMLYSEMGKIAAECWENIPDHFPFMKLGEWVVMPNHVHGVLCIDKPNAETFGGYVNIHDSRDAKSCISTHGDIRNNDNSRHSNIDIKLILGKYTNIL